MPRKPARETLSRATVLQEAVALADVDGVEGVSMRRLAERLDVVPMALYKHVTDKDDLLGGMIEELVADIEAPADDVGWAEAVKRSVLSARAVVLAHPWAAVLGTGVPERAGVLAHLDGLARVMLEGGLSPDLAHHALHVLGPRVWGVSPDGLSLAGKTSPETPALVVLAEDAAERRPGHPCDVEFEFEFAVELILDGIARLQSAGWSST